MTLPATKTDKVPLPVGADPTKYVSAADVNAIVSHIDDVISVNDYGAVGDGVTDDSVAFQAASDAAAALGRATVVAAGTFKLTLVNLGSGVTYDFRGAKFIPSATSTGCFDVAGRSDVTILGGWFSYDGSSKTATDLGRTFTDGTQIYIHGGCSRVVVDGSRFDRCWTGVNVYASSNVHIRNTQHVTANAGIAFLADTVGAVSECSAIGNDIQSADDGIAVQTRGNYDCSNVVIAHNRLNKSHLDGSVAAASGIRVARENLGVGTGKPRHVVVAGNTLYQMIADGIIVDDVENVVISGNTVFGFARGTTGVNGRAFALGLAGQPADRCVFEGNIATGGAGSAYWACIATELTNSVIRGNVMRGNAAGYGAGIDLHTSTHNVVTANRAENAAAGPAIKTSDSSDYNLVFGNDVGTASFPNAQVTGTNDRCFLNTGGQADTLIASGAVQGQRIIANVSSDRGDTNQTLTVGTDAPTQRWATTLTANRTVTLSTTGAVAGDSFRVVRTGLGAFTLAVGGLKTIPSATAAFVDVVYNGSAWVLTGYGTL